jgi:hypothetical protein
MHRLATGRQPFTLTITADGKPYSKVPATTDAMSGVSTRLQASRVAAARVDQIVTVMRRSKLFSLPADMDDAEDSLGYVLANHREGTKLSRRCRTSFRKDRRVASFSCCVDICNGSRAFSTWASGHMASPKIPLSKRRRLTQTPYNFRDYCRRQRNGVAMRRIRWLNRDSQIWKSEWAHLKKDGKQKLPSTSAANA